MLLPLLLLALSSSTTGAPSPDLSINAQVPPVARADHPYIFVFSNSTFTSTAAISYAITNPPGWLQLDSPSRTFSGTPGMQDAGSFVVGLVATDGTGSTTMNVTFVVMIPPGPGLGTPMASQLAAYGTFSSPDSLLLSPSSSLSLSFSPSTFTNTDQNTVYYALCVDNTPLPSWIHFDSSSLAFSGITPQATSPSESPQIFGIQLTASEVVGFAGAVASFQLIVERHLFAFSSRVQIINVTNGMPVNYTGIWSNLYLDGQIINPTEIGQVVADAPSWLSLDQNSLALYGTPPSNVTAQNITVTATDCYGGNTSTVIQLQTSSTFATAVDNSEGTLISPFPMLNATTGSDFTYGLNNTLSSAQGLNVSVDPGPASAWLAFNASGLNIQGHVPSNLKPQSIQVDITAIQGNQTQSQVLTINVAASTSASIRTTSKAGSTSVRPTGSAAQLISKGTPHKGWIAAAVIVPLAVVLGILLLLCCCCRRKCRLKLKFKIKSSEEKKEERKRRIRRLKVEEDNQEDEPKTPLVMTGALDSDHEQASNAPRIHIPRLWKSGTNKRSSNIRHSKATTNSTAQSRKSDPWQKYVGGLESARIVPPLAAVPASSSNSVEHSPARAGATDCDLEAATIEAPLFTYDTPPPRRSSKRTKTISRFSFGSSAKFSSQRVSGLGHGRNAMSQNSSSLFFGNRGVGHGDGQILGGPPGHGVVKKSWRNYSLKRRGSLYSTGKNSWETESASNPDNPLYVEGPQGLETTPIHKTLGSPMPAFPRPPTSSTFDQFKTPHMIRESFDDNEPCRINQPSKPLPRSHRGQFPTRQRSTTDPEPLQAFHKLRRQQNSSNPLWSGGELSQARKLSLHNRVSPKSSSNGDIRFESSSPRRSKVRRSFSQSSSLGIRNPLSPSSRSSNSISGSPPLRKGSLLHNLNFTVRAISLSSRGHESVSSSTSSRFESAASLQFDHDENGDRRWRYADHPNPLTMNRASGTDVSDQDLIDSLRNNGQLGAAQRLTYLKAAAEGGGGGLGSIDKDGNVELNLRSSRGRIVGESVGLRREDTGLKSSKGEVGDAASAFV